VEHVSSMLVFNRFGSIFLSPAPFRDLVVMSGETILARRVGYQ